MFNECQDSLLATPLILDLCLLTELMSRVTYRKAGEEKWENLYSVLGLLSYMLKVSPSLLFVVGTRTHEIVTDRPPSSSPELRPSTRSLARGRLSSVRLPSSSSVALVLTYSVADFLRACLSLQPESDLINFTSMQV